MAISTCTAADHKVYAVYLEATGRFLVRVLLLKLLGGPFAAIHMHEDRGHARRRFGFMRRTELLERFRITVGDYSRPG